MMLSYALYLFLLLNIFPITAAAAAAYTATDSILLNCGESAKMNDSSRRSWEGDHLSSYMPSNVHSISLASTTSNMYPFVYQVPFTTARFFYTPFTYNFSVLAGPKFIRLYFNHNTYSDINTDQSYFSITANGYTLLSNFSAFLNSPSSTFKKEFIIVVKENQRGVNLTFSPNQNSFAFINGIEIFSLPDKLYFKGNDVPIKFEDELFYLKSDTALENVYRLNVGGGNIEIQDDSGMFRSWTQDNDYILLDYCGYTPPAEDEQIKYTAETPQYSAPDIVYKTSRVIGNHSKSLKWGFPVDSGFYYLLRFHFCEIQTEVTKQNQRVFTIAINNQTAEYEMDVIFLTGGTEIPIFIDYITWVPDDGRRGKKDLLLSLFPNMEGRPKYYSALLNGLEMFKLSDSNRSLAGVNPARATIASPAPAGNPVKNKKSGESSIIYVVVGSGIGVLAVGLAVSFLIFRQRRKVKDSATLNATVKSSWLPPQSDLCRHFLLDEIKTATGNFDDNFIIGKGGFGNVYKGFIDESTTAVAIKRLSSSSNQGVHEFLTEIEMLSELRHLHLVSLIGYCNDTNEMILVYDFMANGTLHSHLYNSGNSPLTWNQRLQICTGAAAGLHYLHTGAADGLLYLQSCNGVIHRDVKSSNILLDENWVAKISDFGLSKTGPANVSFTHISTNVKGTFGYLDPEYFLTGKLTRKSDVYAFGVVLFEVLSGRPAVDISLEEEQHSLARWAQYCISEGKVDSLIEHNLRGQILPACLKVFVEIAGRCLHAQPQRRPAMADVVASLELALALQETKNSVEHAGRIYSDNSDAVISVDDSLVGVRWSS